jgi:hypothetical protein
MSRLRVLAGDAFLSAFFLSPIDVMKPEETGKTKLLPPICEYVPDKPLRIRCGLGVCTARPASSQLVAHNPFAGFDSQKVGS